MKATRLQVISPVLGRLRTCAIREPGLTEAGLDQCPARRAWDDYPREWQEHRRSETTLRSLEAG